MNKKYYACVYCGASSRLDDVYINAAEKLGKIIADNGFSLVYGAGASGCMGAAARGVQNNGGYVLGISPTFIKKFEPIFSCDNTVIVDTMSERKTLMEKHADIFFVAPGGIGTMDEFFQVLTLKYLHQLSAPIIVLNINGFYDSLIALVDNLVDLKAANPEIKSYFDVVNAVDEKSLQRYFEAVKTEKR